MVNTPTNILASNSSGGMNSHLLPAGTRVYLSSPGVHYHPKYWPDPYKFDPSRWKATKLGSEDKTSDPANNKNIVAADKARHMRGTLLTFSDGARVCLGRKFAQAEYIAFFACLLRDYSVELAPGMDPKIVEKDLYLKCAGEPNLMPVRSIKLALKPLARRRV